MFGRRLAGITVMGLIILGATRLVTASGQGNGTFEPVQQVLMTIPTGQQALEIIEQYEVGVSFKGGQGTYFMASSNSIVVDDNNGPARAALSLIHEAHHARTWHEGQRAGIELSAEEYVRLRVEEEAEGVVKSIEAKMELQAAGLDVSELHYPLEKDYEAAYTAARQAGQGMDEVELEQVARAAGKAKVLQGFFDGRVLTSQTLEAYPVYYEACWDKAETAEGLLSPVSGIVSGATGFDLLSLVTEMVAESC